MALQVYVIVQLMYIAVHLIQLQAVPITNNKIQLPYPTKLGWSTSGTADHINWSLIRPGLSMRMYYTYSKNDKWKLHTVGTQTALPWVIHTYVRACSLI